MNEHVWTREITKTEQVREVLPPGRFLKYGDVIKEGDLWLYKYAKSEPVIYRNVGSNVLLGEENGKNWYRPDPTNNDYYYLKVGETLQAGDEWKERDGHWNSDVTWTCGEKLYRINEGRARRKIVKPIETKFKVGQRVKILHAGRKGEIGKVVKVLEKDTPESWRNFVLVVGGDMPKYADHELELVDEVEKKPAKASKYRALAPTEYILTGDEYYYTPTRAWRRVSASVGHTVSEWQNISRHPVKASKFRRKVS